MTRILVLGGYGLIGGEIIRRLAQDGHDVVGLARNGATGRRLHPYTEWIEADLAHMTKPDDWRTALSGVGAVVNASGALQDGARDDLEKTQFLAIRALILACEAMGISRFVQISAPSAKPSARTAFYATKGRADEVLRQSRLDWTILKPGLVVGRTAYGGTALVRMLAAFPYVQPILLADAPVETVGVEDVAAATRTALLDPATIRRDFDLVANETLSLSEVVARYRAWLGFSPARALVHAPGFIGGALARLADLAGWLGWRSPMRTTAIEALKEGVIGDPRAWTAATGVTIAPLSEHLDRHPATAQDRLHARASLAFPILVATCAAFWIASGVIGLVRLDAAAAVLQQTAIAPYAPVFVIAGAFADIAIGAALCVRGWMRPAAASSIFLCLGYLAAATVFTPFLWADPLGSLVKVFPAIALALATIATFPER
jgi:uncharacterized protein YbjT (DUF2867 family)